MASRLKWAKASLRGVMRSGRNALNCLEIEGSSRFRRLLKHKHGHASFGSDRTREKRMRATRADSAHGYLRSEVSLKDAVASLISRASQGIAINSANYVDVLQECFRQKDLEAVKQVHDCIKKSGQEVNTYVANNLLKCYIGCGRLQDARELFYQLKTKSIVGWTTVIGGYAENGQAEEAIEVYKQLRKERVQPNTITYLALLKAFTSPFALKWGKDVHAHILQDGLQADVRVSTALVSMYIKCGSLKDGRAVFDRMQKRNEISWTAMIGGLAQHGLGHEAFSLFLQMQREGFTPNAITYLCLLSAEGDPKHLAWVKEVHSHAQKSGLAQHLRVNNALIHMYIKCGSTDNAKLVFDSMKDRDMITWNMIIGGLAQQGLGLQAYSLFIQLQKEGFTPNWITYVSILNPCSSNCALGWVKDVHARATRVGLDLRVGNALIHMYAKMGSIGEARQVFDEMMDRDVVSWTAMIGGLGQHGHGRESLQIFEEMKFQGVKPDGSLYLAVLSACSHAGLVDEGRFYFASMTRDYNIKPVLKHFTCMVDQLGRAGLLEEAKLFILNMPIKPDIITWKALLGACKIYNDPKLGELAAKECLMLEPMDAPSYVLLANIYAAIGKWDQVSLIRNMMRERGIRKNPGRCWIEIKNEVHHFVAGDTSHPEAKEIYAMLNSLSKKLKAEGYVPNTRLVLWNIEEEGDRGSALRTHSEKLAIVYGLLHVAPGKPIRIFKNLRICTDCHTATKLISKITGREIVARDANRFHHFNEGLCSCGDYW